MAQNCNGLSLSLCLSHTHTHTHTRIQTVLYILSYHNKSDQTKRILTKEVNMQTHPLLYIYSIQIKVSTATVKKKSFSLMTKPSLVDQSKI